jgi:hypothetical protein
MKLCEEELRIIKEDLTGTLESYCAGDIIETNAKSLAHLPPNKFEDMDVQDLKWRQLALRKIINEMVKINGAKNS